MNNQLKFNETYSHLKMSCIILNNELSAMKKKNEHLIQKVNKLESTISSIIQRTITKEEMKEIIKEGLSLIINILREKDKVNIQTQTINATIESKKEKVKQIDEVIYSEDLDTSDGICSLTKTEDKRITSWGEDGNISISSYDLKKNKWKRDIHKEKAHNDWVRTLCSLNGNRLISGGDDYIIKVWTISNVNMTPIKEIKEHTNYISKNSSFWRMLCFMF